MASFVKDVFKATIGTLVNKGRGLAAEKLKEGDVADEKFRQLIVREMDDIKSKLDGISGKELAASISFFNDGIVCLGQVLDGDGEQKNAVTAPRADGAIEGTTKEEKTFLLAKGIKNLQLTGLNAGLNEDATEAISRAKKRFKDARREAVKAFGITTLSTSDRLLAMKIRIMATILEQVDNPENALASCRLCLEELHSLPAVQENFSVALKEGIKSKIGKDQRREIIAAVCQMNRIIYDVTQMVLEDGESKAKELLIWPCVDVGKERIDPLRDSRIARKLRKVGMEQCCVQAWSFCQEGEPEHMIMLVMGIAINTKQQFIVADFMDAVKVFDSSGKFLYQFSPPVDHGLVQDVAIDQEDNMYVLVNDLRQKRRGAVHVYDTQANFHHSFLIRPGYDVFSVVVDDSNQILISVTEPLTVSLVSDELYYRYDDDDDYDKNTKEMMVEVYENHGTLLHRIEVMCQQPRECFVSVGDAGRVMVLDGISCTLHLFGAQKNYPLEKKVQLTGCYLPTAITFHKASEHLFVASSCKNGVLRVSLHNKDGEYVRSIPLNLEEEKEEEEEGERPRRIPVMRRNISVITTTNNGRIVVGRDGDRVSVT